MSKAVFNPAGFASAVAGVLSKLRGVDLAGEIHALHRCDANPAAPFSTMKTAVFVVTTR
jgi:hypothetical protein